MIAGTSDATITFLSDFGLEDAFVGVCHGVIARLAPGVRVIDLTHAIAPGDVAHGATVLVRAVPYLPVACHLAVVDPGVGTDRRGVAVATGRGDVLVGPDNGLLVPAAHELGGVTAAYELRSREHRLEPRSASFHGRDVFAPAAAALASGTAPATLGPPVDALVDLQLPRAVVDPDAGTVAAEVVLVDRFGNLQLSVDRAGLAALGLTVGDHAVVSGPAGERTVALVRTFGELPAGAVGAYVDSDGQVALAVNGGSAAETLGAGRGARITVRPAEVGTPPVEVPHSR